MVCRLTPYVSPKLLRFFSHRLADHHQIFLLPDLISSKTAFDYFQIVFSQFLPVPVFQKSSSNNKNLGSFTEKYMNAALFSTLFLTDQMSNLCNMQQSSILDHVLASFPNRVSQSGVIDIGISDHQLIYCTRKTARIKGYCHKQITFCSLQNYSPEIYEEALRKLSFLNYELFDDIDTAYENFIQKVMAVIDNLAPNKNNALRLHHKIGLMLKSWKK